MKKIEKEILKYQAKLTNKINRFCNALSNTEVNMLNLLNRNCLLLDIVIELDSENRKRLVAYDLERRTVLVKYAKDVSSNV